MTYFTWLQKEEWTAADGTFKLHKSKLELAKEEAAAARLPLTASLHTVPVFSMHIDSITTGLVQLDFVTLMLACESACVPATMLQTASDGHRVYLR